MGGGGNGMGSGLWTCRDMGAKDQGWGSGEMGKGCWEGLRILQQSWDYGLVAGPGWGDVMLSRSRPQGLG